MWWSDQGSFGVGRFHDSDMGRYLFPIGDLNNKTRDWHGLPNNSHFDVVQGMAVRDRVCDRTLSNTYQKDILDLKEEGWLLSDAEFNDCIKMPGGRVIIPRIICCHMKFFKKNFISNLVVEQIPQTY